MADVYQNFYNPDVLSCLANLSNDEVFTPPEVANRMLDLLPQELFRSPDTTFLDPACKSGVFLREIAKRLLVGLENEIPDLQQRVDHIFHKQLYGIANHRRNGEAVDRHLYAAEPLQPGNLFSGRISCAKPLGSDHGQGTEGDHQERVLCVRLCAQPCSAADLRL